LPQERLRLAAEQSSGYEQVWTHDVPLQTARILAHWPGQGGILCRPDPPALQKSKVGRRNGQDGPAPKFLHRIAVHDICYNEYILGGTRQE